jgi:hypothetical protein
MLAAAVFHHLKPCVFAALPMQHYTRCRQPGSMVTTISLRTARKIRLRISLDAAGWFHNRSKLSARARSVERSSSRGARGCSFCRPGSAPQAVQRRQAFIPSAFGLTGGKPVVRVNRIYCRRACVTS